MEQAVCQIDATKFPSIGIRIKIKINFTFRNQNHVHIHFECQLKCHGIFIYEIFIHEIEIVHCPRNWI